MKLILISVVLQNTSCHIAGFSPPPFSFFPPLFFPILKQGGEKTQESSIPPRGVENFGILTMRNAGFPIQKSHFECKILFFFRLRRYLKTYKFILTSKISYFFRLRRFFNISQLCSDGIWNTKITEKAPQAKK